MKTVFVYLALVLLRFASPVSSQVTIDDLFTLQGGTTNGGCDNYRNLINDYLVESLRSVTAAINAIDHYNDKTTNGKRVKNAVKIWFGYKSFTGADTVALNLKYIQEFLQNKLQSTVPKADTFLFCNSDWLQQKQPTDDAQDYRGQRIVDGNNIALTIGNVAGYSTEISAGKAIWWSGLDINGGTQPPVSQPVVQGYYFSDSANGDGGNYCGSAGHWGLTSTIRALTANGNNQPTVGDEVNTVILCPMSFTRTDIPATWNAGNAAINVGTTLKDVLPRSATFLHELFHVIQGANFLQADKEFYDQAVCIDKAKSKKTNQVTMTRINPESYVFFIAHMYYLYGDTLNQPDPTQPNLPPSPITIYWDFTKPGDAQPA